MFERAVDILDCLKCNELELGMPCSKKPNGIVTSNDERMDQKQYNNVFALKYVPIGCLYV